MLRRPNNRSEAVNNILASSSGNNGAIASAMLINNGERGNQVNIDFSATNDSVMQRQIMVNFSCYKLIIKNILNVFILPIVI